MSNRLTVLDRVESEYFILTIDRKTKEIVSKGTYYTHMGDLKEYCAAMNSLQDDYVVIPYNAEEDAWVG